MILNIFTDGASKGNPGKSGAGVAIYNNSVLIDTIIFYLGIKTNNEAEYGAVIKALEWVQDKKNKKVTITKINFFADSQLVIKQLKGEYKVKAPTIIPLVKIVKELSSNLEINYTWIRREKNYVADELANKAIENRFN